MLTIHHAILHILDFNSGVTVYSEQELNVQNMSVMDFLSRHLEKSFHDQGAKSGRFYEHSPCKQQVEGYLAGEITFRDFSIALAQTMHDALSQMDILDSVDLLVCDLSIEGQRLLALLKCNNQVGFTHQIVQTEGGIANEIINHYAILPNLAQKLDEYVFIDAGSLDLSFVDKKRTSNGEDVYTLSDKVLVCSSRVSPKDTLKMVSTITKKVAEKHGHSTVTAVAKAKNCLVEQAETQDHLDPVALGREIFAAAPLLQEEYQREVEKIGLTETVKVDREFVRKKGQTHKIKTDTGIEISFPVDYFQNTEYMEFINNPNGTICIELKNIGKISNK